MKTILLEREYWNIKRTAYKVYSDTFSNILQVIISVYFDSNILYEFSTRLKRLRLREYKFSARRIGI